MTGTRHYMALVSYRDGSGQVVRQEGASGSWDEVTGELAALPQEVRDGLISAEICLVVATLRPRNLPPCKVTGCAAVFDAASVGNKDAHGGIATGWRWLEADDAEGTPVHEHTLAG